MLTFAFWNLKRKPLEALVAALAAQYDVDVLVLTECAISPATLLMCLNTDGLAQYHYAPGIGCEKIEIYARFPDDYIRPISESDRLTIRHVTLPGLTDILLAAVHFPSKMHWNEASQALECTELARIIREGESQVAHHRTILVGDLNMNPFEDGIVGAAGLHGTMSRRIAERRSRTIYGTEYPFFYNPMWRLLGDGRKGPPGTFYYSGSEQRVFFWNMFDQVLVRPDLLPGFDAEGVEIVTNVGATSLLSVKGLPNAKEASDHLPLVFRLDM